MLGCVYGATKFRPSRTYNHISGDSLERQQICGTGVVIKIAMDNVDIMVGVRFFDAAPKDRMVRYFLMSFQKTRNP